ncbi:hypothetical protein BH23ACT3_BH23ACT3_15290 [soil metagenome]
MPWGYGDAGMARMGRAREASARTGNVTDRRALLRRLIGFSVGFGAALAIIVATEFSRSQTPVDSRVVGDLDVFEYCRGGEFQLEAALRQDDAYGWRCVGRRNGIWGFDEVDFDDACRVQHGPDAAAVTDDPQSPYAWQCTLPG